MATAHPEFWPTDARFCAEHNEDRDDCETLHTLLVFARTGELASLVCAMVEEGCCQDGREWLRIVLEVRA